MSKNNSTLSQKAMLVKLSISQWTAKKYDKTVSDKIAADYNADVSSGRYNKVLIARDAINSILRIAHEARSYHYENTLPWGDDNYRMLPAANYMLYSAEIRKFKAAFEAEVNAFVNAYPALVNDAKKRLNGMFNSADYPDQTAIRAYYDMDAAVTPLPADDFRVTLQADELKTIRADIETRTKQAQAEAMRDLWNRLYGAVDHMAERLSGKDNVFRDTLVQNVIDLCSLLPRLNVSEDQELEKMRREVEERLCKTTPQELRNNNKKRKQVGKDADGILSAMAGYIGGANECS